MFTKGVVTMIEETKGLTTAEIKGLIDIRRLKTFALANLSRSLILRYLLLSESDELPKADFIVKIGLWLKISRRELAK